jgi:hypothetical protein
MYAQGFVEAFSLVSFSAGIGIRVYLCLPATSEEKLTVDQARLVCADDVAVGVRAAFTEV